MTVFTDAMFRHFQGQHMAFGLTILFLGAAVFYLRKLSNPDTITTRRSLIGKTVVATIVSICSAVTCVGLAYYSSFYGTNGLFTTLDIIAGAFVLLVSLVSAYKLITAVRPVRWSQIFATLAIVAAASYVVLIMVSYSVPAFTTVDNGFGLEITNTISPWWTIADFARDITFGLLIAAGALFIRDSIQAYGDRRVAQDRAERSFVTSSYQAETDRHLIPEERARGTQA